MLSDQLPIWSTVLQHCLHVFSVSYPAGVAAGGADGGEVGSAGVTGIADAPAGDDEHLLATGEKGEKVR